MDFDYIVDGCYVFGCVGGGNLEVGKMQFKYMVEVGYMICVIDILFIDEVDIVYWGGWMGIFVVIVECF